MRPASIFLIIQLSNSRDIKGVHEEYVLVFWKQKLNMNYSEVLQLAMGWSIFIYQGGFCKL